MRSRHLNFALGVAASVAAHILLWPAARHITVAGLQGLSSPAEDGEVTIALNDDAPKPATKPPLPKPPKPPLVEPPDEMGQADGKGTGAQPAKGKDPLRAPEFDQDQAFLSRDPVGMGRVGDPPTFFTGPRGENGSGGQVGGSPSPANPAHTPSPDDLLSPPEPSALAPAAKKDALSRPPRQSVVHVPEPDAPKFNEKQSTAPQPSKTASAGAAPADVERQPADEIKTQLPLAQVKATTGGEIAVAPREGPTTAPSPASSVAPPVPNASPERMAVALAPDLPVPKSAVDAPPPPAIDVQLPRPADKPPTPPKPAPTPLPQGQQAVVTTGDARAPGPDRTSADPAQESDSESDAFAKKLISAVVHDGRLDVRHGRKVTTTRPHFLPGAEAAFFAHPNPILVFKVSINERGKVVDVQPIRVTGAVEIDQPCRIAMYDWTFEPTHNAKGQAVPDVLPFEIQFR